MKHYEPKKFDIPPIEGISEKQIEEHLKLYQGYVKHTKTIIDQIEAWAQENKPENDYLSKELWRRFGFEFDGMRSHEYYFGALEGGVQAFDPESALGKLIIEEFGSYNGFVKALMNVATTRGSGWALVTYDHVADTLFITWADEHHLGHLSSLPFVMAVDCWEHAYMVDYLPGERKKYLESYLNAVNWDVVNKWFEKARG